MRVVRCIFFLRLYHFTPHGMIKRGPVASTPGFWQRIKYVLILNHGWGIVFKTRSSMIENFDFDRININIFVKKAILPSALLNNHIVNCNKDLFSFSFTNVQPTTVSLFSLLITNVQSTKWLRVKWERERERQRDREKEREKRYVWYIWSHPLCICGWMKKAAFDMVYTKYFTYCHMGCFMWKPDVIVYI